MDTNDEEGMRVKKKKTFPSIATITLLTYLGLSVGQVIAGVVEAHTHAIEEHSLIYLFIVFFFSATFSSAYVVLWYVWLWRYDEARCFCTCNERRCECI